MRHTSLCPSTLQIKSLQGMSLQTLPHALLNLPRKHQQQGSCCAWRVPVHFRASHRAVWYFPVAGTQLKACAKGRISHFWLPDDYKNPQNPQTHLSLSSFQPCQSSAFQCQDAEGFMRCSDEWMTSSLPYVYALKSPDANIVGILNCF